MNQDPDSTFVTWSVPQCPFAIEFRPRVLDDIRLGIIDAFFSLPRGGAEIGGVLLGRYTSGRLSILGYRQLDCEHAFGPSFTLSERDHVRLQELLAAVHASPGDPQPVGWYHSHTRSEIFLSDVDREVHDRFFAEPWQVALVLKPHTFRPTRAGFFFREADGQMHVEQSYLEIVLDALPLAATSPSPTTSPASNPAHKLPHEPRRAMITLDAVAEAPTQETPAPPRPVPVLAPALPDLPAPRAVSSPPPAPSTPPPAVSAVVLPDPPKPRAVPEPPPVLPPAAVTVQAEEETAQSAQSSDAALPRFLAVEMPPPKRRWRRVMVALGWVALGAFGYLTHGLWWDEVSGAVQSLLPAGPPPPLKLHALDANGQLQIQWDATSSAIIKPRQARLTISDGPKPRVVALDAAHLSSGAFTYARQTERVDVALAITESNGQAIREQTTFLGKAPAVSGDQAAANRELEDQRAANRQLGIALENEREKSKKMEKELRYLREQRERELRLKRLEKQIK